VVRAAEALFAAMEARDTAALRRMFVPEARLVVVRVQEGAAPATRTASVSDFVGSLGQGTERLRERMWDPRAEVHGDFASLWAPYDFHVDERFSHCGVDAFHFVRTGGAWRIAALSYTVQTAGCLPPPTR